MQSIKDEWNVIWDESREEMIEGIHPIVRWGEWTDADPRWMGGTCINDVVKDSGAFLHLIQYSADDPDEDWLYYLAGIQMHHGRDCNDPDPEYFLIPTGQSEIEEPPTNRVNPEQLIPGESPVDMLNAPTVYSPDIDEFGGEYEMGRENGAETSEDHVFGQGLEGIQQENNLMNIENRGDDNFLYGNREEIMQELMQSSSEEDMGMDTSSDAEPSELGSDQVQNLDVLEFPEMEIEDRQYTVHEIDLYAEGYRYGKETSMRLISDISREHATDVYSMFGLNGKLGQASAAA
ncbi:hypothetical protein ABW19_dt0209292 [Dactylella cylindrospora]|nr:hypothetical protein ABW19_dt0209292 [Dactylella cylindrospora]